MKKIFYLCLAMLLGIASCDKVDDLPLYGSGTASQLTASAASIAPAPADSNNTVLTLNWTYPNHATDSALIKYVVEIDSVSKNFSNPYRKTVNGILSTEFIAKDLNTALLGRGYAFNVPVSMEVRVISSYANNNERIVSNVVPVKMTPYKVPPRVALPVTGKLFIIGSSTATTNPTDGGWFNPVPTPVQELSRIDETTWGGVFELSGGGQYLILPENGSWSNKFCIGDASLPVEGGDFGFNIPAPNDKNFNGPANSGWYLLILDFQTGKYSLTPYANAQPSTLYIVGDATTGGWNPSPPASQQFTRLNASEYELSIALQPGKAYKFLSSFGNWQPQFGSNSATGGELKANYGGGNDPDAVPTPSSAGTYKIKVNFATKEHFAVGKYAVTQ